MASTHRICKARSAPCRRRRGPKSWFHGESSLPRPAEALQRLPSDRHRLGRGPDRPERARRPIRTTVSPPWDDFWAGSPSCPRGSTRTSADISREPGWSRVMERPQLPTTIAAQPVGFSAGRTPGYWERHRRELPPWGGRDVIALHRSGCGPKGREVASLAPRRNIYVRIEAPCETRLCPRSSHRRAHVSKLGVPCTVRSSRGPGLVGAAWSSTSDCCGHSSDGS